jgi:hypothetical protein
VQRHQRTVPEIQVSANMNEFRALHSRSLPYRQLSRIIPSTHIRWLSSKHKPAFQIPAHVAAFGLLLIPALAFTFFADRFGPDEEVLENEIRERYANEVKASSQKSQQMAEFFQHAIRNQDGQVDQKLDEVLKAGKGGKKRMYAVDEKLYGTAEGAAERLRQEAEQKNKKKKNKKNAVIVRDENRKDTPAPTEPPRTSLVDSIDPKSLAAVAGVATVAAAVGYLAGGSRR